MFTRTELGRLRAKRDMLSAQTKEKQERISNLDETLFEICGSQDLNDEITIIKEEIDELQETKGLKTLSTSGYGDF